MLAQQDKAISKQENAHQEAALLEAGDFNAGKLKSVLPHFHQHVQPEGKKTTTSGPPLLHTETHTKLSLALHLVK